MKHIILLSQTSRNNCSGKSVISFTVSSFYLKEREKTKTATQVDKTFDFFIFIKVWALPPPPILKKGMSSTSTKTSRRGQSKRWCRMRWGISRREGWNRNEGESMSFHLKCHDLPMFVEILLKIIKTSKIISSTIEYPYYPKARNQLQKNFP